MLESSFQAEFRATLKNTFPGCLVFKVDSGFMQGAPDLFMVYGDRWAAFEMKRSSNASKQVNQTYYIDRMNEMSFAAFVDPTNVLEVLDALQRSFSR